MLHIYEDNNEIHKTVWKRGDWKYNGGREHAQCTLYACMDLSQWNPFAQLIYASKIYT
jgi:hypothetical protein